MTNDLINYDDRKTIDTLKNTVAQGLTDPEFMLFAQLCRSSGLNPFKKEVWAIKAGGRLQVMVGVNGYWTIANSHPQFDGYEEDIEVDEAGNPIKAWCKIYRKDRKFPSMGVAIFRECAQQSPVWKSRPSQMILKCAESFAIRKAFPQELNGLYTEEEMPQEYSKGAVNATVATPKKEAIVAQPPAPQVYYYDFPDGMTPEQEAFMDMNAEYLQNLELWMSNVRLHPKLDKFLVNLQEYQAKRAAAKDEEDDLPDSFSKPVEEEKPLEKAKRRAAAMQAELGK